jgi:disulfide oxidoreductase YuzD
MNDTQTNTMAESSSSPAAPPKPVVVRVKRKPSQSPLDALWLEINERPLKRSLLDFGNLSLSHSSKNNVELHNKKVLVQHVETISSSEVTLDIVQSFVEPDSTSASESKSKVEERKNFFKKVNKQDQLLSKAKQVKESSAKDARFEQIWKSRKENKGTTDVNALHEICQFYDIVRVDSEEKTKEVQQEDISLEDQKLLSSYLPLLREVMPNAAAEIEADISSHPKQEDYVYDLYTVTDETIVEEDSSYSYPVIQVEDEDFYDGPDDSDYDTDDSNAEGNIKNDYPDEISDEDEGSKSESEESKDGTSSNESSKDEEDGDDGTSDPFYDPLYDEDFDHYKGQGGDNDEDEQDDLDNEHNLRWSYR